MPPTSRLALLWSRSTLLPRGIFPVRALAKERPLFLNKCTDQLYAYQRKFAGPSTFELHDGPPYANGSLHVGHALNKILKDIVCRYQVLKGTKVQYTPGWDCHGLPIELKALQGSGDPDNAAGKLSSNAIATRAAARRLAMAAVEEQKKTFQEWGIMADWKNAWTTMDSSFEIKQLEVFQKMVARGLIHRRNKPVYWSPSTKTALAEAELQYREDHTSQAAYVAFPITGFGSSPLLKRKRFDIKTMRVMVWTTTPWTIPANLAIAVNPDMEYTIVDIDGHGPLVVSKAFIPRRAEISHKYGMRGRARQCRIKGSELVGLTYQHPLLPKDAAPHPILAAAFVTKETGTGLVHCAPGHGMDDYKLGQAHGLATFAPIDDNGCFTKEALPHDPALLQGKAVLDEGNEAVTSLLKDAKALVATAPYSHKYPYDWRSKLPVVQRATPQWFADLTSIQEAAISAIDRVQFVPQTGKERLLSFVQNRAEWCISRQRAWGVPIPALYHKYTGEAILTETSVVHIIETIKSRGIDAWWTDNEDDSAWTPQSLLGPNGENAFRRGSDTMDVWFDSGTTWTQIKSDGQEAGQPVADVYLEGSDQHRGWFQSSLLTFVAQSLQEPGARPPSAPFKTLITHGFTLDEKGRKMSKSEGNVITPQEIMDPTLWDRRIGTNQFDQRDISGDHGPDVLRLWVAMSDYQKDISISSVALGHCHRMMKKFRMSMKLLVNLQKGSDLPIPIVFKDLNLVDRVALIHLRKMDEEVRLHYEKYDFHKVMAAINNYVRNDFSKFYIEAIKDRMYLDGIQSLSRSQGLTVLWEISQRLIHRMSPVLPLLAEEVAHYLTLETNRDCAPLPWKDKHLQSHMATWGDARLEEHMAVLFETKSAIFALQEEYGRKVHKMGSSLQSYVSIEFDDDESDPSLQLFQSYSAEELEAFFVVSRVSLNTRPNPSAGWQTSAPVKAAVKDQAYAFTVHISAPTDEKCVRCWRYVVSEDEAAQLEEPLCQRCMGSWSIGPFAIAEKELNNPAWLEEHIPRIQAATVALKEKAEKEVDPAWRKFHWDAELEKIRLTSPLDGEISGY